MIWSVSTSLRMTATPLPVIRCTPLIAVLPFLQIRRRGEVPSQRCRGRDSWRHQGGAPARPLPPLEVSVAGRGGPLAGRQDVAVHPEAHGATGRPPLEPGIGEQLV